MLGIKSFKDDGCIVATETECIAHDNIQLPFFFLV
jgi:hypothetical protein